MKFRPKPFTPIPEPEVQALVRATAPMPKGPGWDALLVLLREPRGESGRRMSASRALAVREFQVWPARVAFLKAHPDLVSREDREAKLARRREWIEGGRPPTPPPPPRVEFPIERAPAPAPSPIAAMLGYVPPPEQTGHEPVPAPSQAWGDIAWEEMR